MTRRKIVVGMSGGVDSSIAAWLLKKQGHKVIGLFMKNWEGNGDRGFCSMREDWIDAISVADLIGIEIDIVNFTDEYRNRVFSKFLDGYSIGNTPNPDVFCNTEIKFGTFLEHAMNLGADTIATGHYARVEKVVNGLTRFSLYRAFDNSKDQSYFLYRLGQKQLERVLFPLGTLSKKQVRRIAKEIGLPNADKKDSTGICFIGERPFREFLGQYVSMKPGPIKTMEDIQIGKHIGLPFYTLGQRRGLGIGGNRQGNGNAWYVARKDTQSNTLYVVQGVNHPCLFSDKLSANNSSWTTGFPPSPGDRFKAKIRYQQTSTMCVVEKVVKNSINSISFTLRFDIPQRAITPGQSVVIYDGEECIGGGIISSSY